MPSVQIISRTFGYPHNDERIKLNKSVPNSNHELHFQNSKYETRDNDMVAVPPNASRLRDIAGYLPTAVLKIWPPHAR